MKSIRWGRERVRDRERPGPSENQAGSISEAVNSKVRPDTDDYLGSSMYFKYKANNVVLLKSRVLC